MKIIDETTLGEYVRRSGAKPFGYKDGEIDCSRFVAEWLEAIGKNNVAKNFDYSSAKDAAALIKKFGGMNKLAGALSSECGVIDRGDDYKPGLGDVGIVKFKRKRVFAIATGDGRWVCKTARGVVIAPMQHTRCWSVTYKGAVGGTIIGELLLGLVFGAEAVGIGGTVLIGNLTVAGLVGNIVLAAASIGLQYALASLNKPKQDPGQNQQIIKQAVGPRVRHYGTVKVGGTIVFTEAKNGKWYEVVVTGSGEIDAVVETWANNKALTLTAGVNSTAPWKQFIEVYSRLGLDSETAYSNLTAAIPSWTANHKLNGLSSFLRVIRYPGDKGFRNFFPGGWPKFRQVLRGAKVYDPRVVGQSPSMKSTWTWSDNAALCILDYMTHPDGYNIPKSKMDMASWSAFADVCDQLVPLKSGGSEKRYRLSGTYSFAEARRDVLRRMLQTCDGQIVQLANGKVGIVGGQFITPSVTLDGTTIIAADWQSYRPAPERVNELKPVYVSPSHDFQQVEAGPWQDAVSITADGLNSQNYDVQMVPSNGQAQRLAKIAGRRINSPAIGNLKCNLGALAAFQERFININDPISGTSGVFIVDKFEIAVSEGTIGVNLGVTQVDQTDWEWNAETEEKDAPPVPPDTESATDVPEPTGLTATVVPVTINTGTSGAQISISWDAPADETLSTEIQYRRRISTGPDVWAPYESVSFEAGVVTGLSGVIQNDGSLYEVQARHVRASANSDWTTPVTVVAASDPTAPGVVTGLSATGGAGQITANWTAPASTNYAGSRIYWNTSNSLTGATLVTTVYGVQSQAHSRIITGLSAGTKYVLITAINGSGVASSHVSASATVT